MKSWKKIAEDQLDELVADLKKQIAVPALIMLTGEVGAGKTTLVQHFIEGETVASPTYSLLNEYHESVHGDFYRISNVAEIMHLELALYLQDKKYFFVEWGMPYLQEIVRELEYSYHLYELKIEIGPQWRNYYFCEIVA